MSSYSYKVLFYQKLLRQSNFPFTLKSKDIREPETSIELHNENVVDIKKTAIPVGKQECFIFMRPLCFPNPPHPYIACIIKFRKDPPPWGIADPLSFPTPPPFHLSFELLHPQAWTRRNDSKHRRRCYRRDWAWVWRERSEWKLAICSTMTIC